MNDSNCLTEPCYALLSIASKAQLGALYTAVFEQVGYFATPGKGLSLDEVDYVLYKPDLSEPEIAMRCRPDVEPVSKQAVIRFWNKINERGYSRGIYATNGSFCSSAIEFASGRELLLIDADRLQAGLEDLPPECQEEILGRGGLLDSPGPALDPFEDLVAVGGRSAAIAAADPAIFLAEPNSPSPRGEWNRGQLKIHRERADTSRSSASIPRLSLNWSSTVTWLAVLSPVLVVAAALLLTGPSGAVSAQSGENPSASLAPWVNLPDEISGPAKEPIQVHHLAVTEEE